MFPSPGNGPNVSQPRTTRMLVLQIPGAISRLNRISVERSLGNCLEHVPLGVYDDKLNLEYCVTMFITKT